MTTSSTTPILHVKRLFRVRIIRAGVAPYTYKAKARAAFELWDAAYDRAMEANPTVPIVVMVIPLDCAK